jgi:hypothetical protein
MFKPNTATEGRNRMNNYQFADLPSNAAVSSLVTVLVSAWFVLAAGAILTDQHSEGTLEMARTPSAQAQIVPDAHFSIVVEARRSAS